MTFTGFTSSDYDYTSANPLYEGQVATSVPNVMRGQYNSNDKIPLGRALTWDERGKTVKVIDATGQKLIGISALMQIYEMETNTDGDIVYPAKVKFQFMEKGEIGVVAEDDIDLSTNPSVYMRHTANVSPGSFDRVGRFRSDADGGNADLVPNARWITGGVAGKELVIHVDNPFF